MQKGRACNFPCMCSVERLLLEEGNPMSLVFQILTPPLSARRVCPPPNKGGGYIIHTCRAGEGGGGVKILEDERHRIALLQ
jgi:hypothetical protein